MARNVEIKAHLNDFRTAAIVAKRLSGSSGEAIHQRDVFFHSPSGRLKLRFLSPSRGELIFYNRPDQTGPKTSNYLLYFTDAPEQLKTVIESAYGVEAVVEKERLLFLVGRTRIHLDSVKGLGEFLELEVVLEEGEEASAGEKEAYSLMSELGVETSSLIAGAYVDMLLRAE